MRPHLQAPSMPHPVSSPSQISHILGSNPVSLTDLLPLPLPQPQPARSSLGPMPSLPALSGHPCLKHKLQGFCHDPVYLSSNLQAPQYCIRPFHPGRSTPKLQVWNGRYLLYISPVSSQHSPQTMSKL